MSGVSLVSWFIGIVILYLLFRYVIWVFIVSPFLDWYDFKQQQSIDCVLVQLLPPSVDAAPSSTEEFFRVLHGLFLLPSTKDKLFRTRSTFSCEIVSTYSDGIRFFMRVPRASYTIFENYLSTYLSNTEFQEVEDYWGNSLKDGSEVGFIEFRSQPSYVPHLYKPKNKATQDSSTYLMGSLTKPKPGELLVVQLILSPYASLHNTDGRDLVRPVYLVIRLLNLLRQIFAHVYNVALLLINLFLGKFELPIKRKQGINRETVLEDYASPLFYTDIRACVISDRKERVLKRLRSIEGSMVAFGNSSMQNYVATCRAVNSLSKLSFRRSRILHEYQTLKFARRLTSIFRTSSSLLPSNELADIFHPNEGNEAIDGLVR